MSVLKIYAHFFLESFFLIYIFVAMFGVHTSMKANSVEFAVLQSAVEAAGEIHF